MKETPEQIISKCVNNIVREIASWKYMQEHGCNDPFWSDGCNMNLTRNHIISYKYDIRGICEENNMPLPEGYYLPTPAYKNYKDTGSMSQYNADVDGIVEKYRNDRIMLNFCKNLIISWAPVINKVKEDD